MSDKPKKHKGEPEATKPATKEAEADVVVEEKPAEPVQEQIKPAANEAEKLREQLMRQMAEYDNYRKRTARERAELEPEVTAKVLTKFLSILDNLDRALTQGCSDEGFLTGIKLVRDNFTALLEESGVSEIDTSGKFDPALHQAIRNDPAEGKENGDIAAVFQKGYKLGDKRILRFAVVSVVNN
ncbi:MAG: nucleotide exchange factor GrpE [Oscillospiraceae bacterium]|nr:nucleotide exchange factor GrpE [Oscillospiraceae bacterium]